MPSWLGWLHRELTTQAFSEWFTSLPACLRVRLERMRTPRNNSRRKDTEKTPVPKRFHDTKCLRVSYSGPDLTRNNSNKRESHGIHIEEITQAQGADNGEDTVDGTASVLSD